MTDEQPTQQEVSDAIFGKWEGQKRKPGLLERIGRIERLLLLSVPVLVARALGVPTDVFGKFFSDHSLASGVMQHLVAFLVGFPK